MQKWRKPATVPMSWDVIIAKSSKSAHTFAPLTRAVVNPFAGYGNPFPGGDRRGMADDRHEITMAARHLTHPHQPGASRRDPARLAHTSRRNTTVAANAPRRALRQNQRDRSECQ